MHVASITSHDNFGWVLFVDKLRRECSNEADSLGTSTVTFKSDPLHLGGRLDKIPIRLYKV